MERRKLLNFLDYLYLTFIYPPLRLNDILADWIDNDKGSVIIFVDKQQDADDLFKEIRMMGFECLLLHGGMDAKDREFTIFDFKKQLMKIMVATSVCARGLDIAHITLVLNYQSPNHMEDYIHRVGRTGRAGKQGTAITFITPEEDQYCLDLRAALLGSGNPIPPKLEEMVEGFKQKVRAGEAKVYVNRNIQGSGFSFDEQERAKADIEKKMLKKQLEGEIGIQNENSDDEAIIVQKINRSEAGKQKSVNQVLALIKDPQAKKQIEQEGIKAANVALAQGISATQVREITIEAIKQAILNYSKSQSLENKIE